MSDTEVSGLFLSLYDDLLEQDDLASERPFLAHYTSLEAFEKIIRTNEIWFSNPLLMNDFEEVRAGFFYGARALQNNDALREAWQTKARYDKFLKHVDYYTNDYDEKNLLDTYVFCFSEIDPENVDGLLSMWRGYGGDGKGVALVITTKNITLVDDSPLIFAKVKYVDSLKRNEWLTFLCTESAKIIANNQISDDQIYIASHALVERIKIAALFSKHIGFSEENEWRVVYLSERDQTGALRKNLHYIVGKRGVEPKLRLPLTCIPTVTAVDFKFDDIVHRIIIGPSISSPFSAKAVKRLLEVLDKSDLIKRLNVSDIPYRPFG